MIDTAGNNMKIARADFVKNFPKCADDLADDEDRVLTSSSVLRNFL